MATTHQYLIFTINLTSLSQVLALQGTGSSVVGAGVGAILDVAPDTAALGPFDATLKHYNAPKLAKTAKFVAPSITSEWFGTENQFPTNVGTFDRKSGGWFGWSFLFGDTTHYHWRGIFNYVGSDVAPGPIQVAIPTRRWIDGFEMPTGGAGGTFGTSPFSRGSSRHVDGMGLCLRQSATIYTHLTNENGAASPRDSWERFYMRIREYPTAACPLWRARSTLSPAAGFALWMLPSGQLALYTLDGSSNLTLVATTAIGAFTLNVWARVDIFLGMGSNGIGASQRTLGGLMLWVNGLQKLNFAQSPATGVQGGTDRHTSSEIGGNVANDMSVDIDDWINAAIPRQAVANGLGEFPMDVRGVDWQLGTKIVLISPKAINSGVNWVGDVRALMQNPQPTTGTATTVTSSTSGATLLVDTDSRDTVQAQPNSQGLISLTAMLSALGVLAPATLGFSAGAEVLGTLSGLIVQNGTNFIHWFANVAAGLYTPVKVLNPIQFSHVHGAAGLETIRGMFGQAELAGTFGAEDVGYVSSAALSLDNVLPTVTPKVIPSLGVHNSPYSRTPWARQTTTPQQPVFVRGGTFVGNGTGQDLLFPIPMHWYFARPLTGSTGGVRWWSSMMGAHRSSEQQIKADGFLQPNVDADYVPGAQDTQQMQVIGRVAGALPDANANAVTYQYIAIGDPGQRFMINGVIRQHKGTVDEITSLVQPLFTPKAVWIQAESINGSTTQGGNYKGPGHGAAFINPINAAELGAAVTLAAGAITTKSAFMGSNSYDNMPFSAFRTDDGGTTLAASNNGQVVQIGSYTGDGNASRTVLITPVSGRRPMFAMVIPHNSGAAIFRDPSHTGVTSSNLNDGTSVATSGIVGGDIDQLLIGTTINSNGVVYDYFVIPGTSAAGGNAGWSVNADIIPVDPTPPPAALGDVDNNGPEPGVTGPTADPVVPTVIFDPLAPTGPMPSLTDDVDPSCTLETHRTINMALSRIGITKAIVNVATDNTTEAVQARLQYNEAIQETLRDFPWPFATRYAQLAVLNGGTQPNSDWLYAYRQPSDCIFERRLVLARTGSVDPAPAPFQLATDDTGGIIWCNVASAVLEYTARPKCPHTRSEPLFRDAAAWKLAAKFAPGLSRMTDAAINCEKMYQATIEQARLVLKPGNPGEAAATSAYDTTAAQQAANVAVANLALVRIGAKTIRNLTTDQSREAQTVRLVFEQELRATLRSFPWPFATVYYTPTLVGGTATVPVNNDWQYSYRLPADVVLPRRMVTPAGRAYERYPPPFKLSSDATGPLLYTDLDGLAFAVVLEYTTRPAGAVSIADDDFRDALAWRLAWSLAPSLAQADPTHPTMEDRGPDDPTKAGERRPLNAATQLRARMADYAREQFEAALMRAKAHSANSALPDLRMGDADWIRERDGQAALGVRGPSWWWDRG